MGASALVVIVALRWPEFLGLAAIGASTLALGVVASIWCWKRGSTSGAFAPLAGATAVLVLVGYGSAAPRLEDLNSHRALAETLDRILPADVRTVMFYRELDEGLWYYLRDRRLVAVPGSQPEYNKGFDILMSYKEGRLIWDETERRRAAALVMVDWLEGPEAEIESPYVLIRADDYDLLSADFADLVTPVYREPETRP